MSKKVFQDRIDLLRCLEIEDGRLMIFGNFRISDFLLPEGKEPVQINPYEVNVQFSGLQSTI